MIEQGKDPREVSQESLGSWGSWVDVLFEETAMKILSSEGKRKVDIVITEFLLLCL